MNSTIQHLSFVMIRAETEAEQQRAAEFVGLLQHAPVIIARMSNELAASRRQHDLYCHAMEERGRELAEQDEVIEQLRQQARKQARHKIYWMAAACLTWVGFCVWWLWRLAKLLDGSCVIFLFSFLPGIFTAPGGRFTVDTHSSHTDY